MVLPQAFADLIASLRNAPGDSNREHPILLRSGQWIHRSRAAFYIAYGTLLFGVYAEFGGDHMSAALLAAARNARESAGTGSLAPLNRPADLPTILFLLALLPLGWLISTRLQADDERQMEEKLDIFRALYRVPNVNVIKQYPDAYWPTFTSALASEWPDALTPPQERRDAMARCIRDALAVVAEMARQFSRADGARYGANIMLIVRPGDDPRVPFPPAILEVLRFHSKKALGELAGVLYLPEELRVASIDSGRPRHVPVIALPVPERGNDGDGHRLVIPGAPEALITGLPSAYEDTARMANDCRHLDARIRHEVATYFSPRGEGREIRSFVSLRLGDDAAPVGVLNIDSDYTHVLGLHEHFYVSFYALARPMLDRLHEAVASYSDELTPALWEPDRQDVLPTSGRR